MPNTDTQHYDLSTIKQHVALTRKSRVLEMGYYDTAGALWAAEHAGTVVALRHTIDLVAELDRAAVAVTQAAESPDARMVSQSLHTRLATTMPPEEAGSFDAAILLAPFFLGNAPVREAIHTAAVALKPSGALFTQLHKRHGGGTYVRYLEETFGEVEMLELGHGQRRLYRAAQRKPEAARLDLPEDKAVPPAELETRGVTLKLRLAAGVFSAQRIDPGSQLLISTATVRPGAGILDLGCGAGTIGLALAAADPSAQVVLVDTSVAAVELARENAAANGLTNVEVLTSDGYASVRGEEFDAIVSNLPAHRGHRQDLTVAERFIAEAPRHLTERGAAWFVANRALPYELPASNAFRQVTVAANDGRYKVLHCTNPRKGR